MKAAFKPAQPSAPYTSVIASNIVINWVAPSANGSPITGYRITIKQQDGTYTSDLSNCDGTAASSIVTNKQCTVPIATLTSSPYLLTLGDNVYAKVYAINFYGESASSDAGNGGTILYVPSKPVGLTNNLSVTTASIIGLTWNNGISTGGSPILDYRVSYDHSTGVWTTLETGIVP